VEYKPVNVSLLQERFGDSEHKEITPELLVEVGIIKRSDKAVAILGDGELTSPLTIKAHRFSKSAQAKIEAAGGTVEVLPLS
jgi:large subunit ribosomal protein L15